MLDSLDTLIAFTLIMLVVSLLITIAVQMVSAALNLRGWNFAKGLTKTLETVVPGTEKQAKALVDYVLTGSMISDSSFMWLHSFWRRATAVRADEVFDAIHQIALGKQKPPEDLRLYALNLMTALGMDTNSVQAAAGKISDSDNIFQAVKESMPALPDKDHQKRLESALEEVKAKLTAYANAEATRIVQSGISAEHSIDHVYQKFEYWFDLCQERVQQWFAAHTRFITIIFAIIFAFGLQLDAVEIFKLVSTNHVMRDQLIAQATTVASQAEKSVGDNRSLLEESLNLLIAEQNDKEIKDALSDIKVENSDTRQSLLKKLNKAFVKTKNMADDLVSDFDNIINEVATKRLNEQAADFQTVKADLDRTGFDLLPKGNKWRWGETWSEHLWPKHLLGIIFTVALLSLGAPFWFNILKSLTSLRSTVAQNIYDEQQQANKQPELSTATKAPPTMR